MFCWELVADMARFARLFSLPDLPPFPPSSPSRTLKVKFIFANCSQATAVLNGPGHILEKEKVFLLQRQRVYLLDLYEVFQCLGCVVFHSPFTVVQSPQTGCCYSAHSSPAMRNNIKCNYQDSTSLSSTFLHDTSSDSIKSSKCLTD